MKATAIDFNLDK